MRTRGLGILSCAFLFGCGDIVDCDIIGSGNVVQISRPISSAFGGMAISNGFSGRVTIDSSHTGDVELDLRLDDNLVEFLVTRVVEDTLEIRLREDFGYCDVAELRADTTVPPIDAFNLSGGAAYKLRGVTADDMSLNTSGGSNLDASGRASTWDLNQSGGSDVILDLTETSTRVDVNSSGGSLTELTGGVRDLQVNVSGGGTFDGLQLTTQTTRVDASGGSTLNLCVEISLEGTASGGSDINYACDPVGITVETSGGSTVSGI